VIEVLVGFEKIMAQSSSATYGVTVNRATDAAMLRRNARLERRG
jgi:hypothetical protein